jgi:hypothetical protein
MDLLQVATDNARVLEFYKTASGLSFTLLGLWWVVIQLRPGTGRAIRLDAMHMPSCSSSCCLAS